MDILNRKILAIRKCSFAGSPSFVQIYQSLLKLGVIVLCCDINSVVRQK